MTKATSSRRSKAAAALELLPTEVVRLEDLKAHPRNYQKHPPDQIEHIRASLRKHDWYRPFVIAEDNTILAGHGLLEAALLEGRTEGPARRLPLAPDHPLALEVLVGDNELNNLAEVDDRLLTELLREVLQSAEGDLLGTGIDEMQLAALTMVTRHADEIEDMDAAAEWIGMPEFGSGPPPITLAIQFESQEAREEFVVANGWEPHYKRRTVWSMWWPPRVRDDRTSIRFETAADG